MPFYVTKVQFCDFRGACSLVLALSVCLSECLSITLPTFKIFQVLPRPFKSFQVFSWPFKSFQVLQSHFKSLQVRSSPFKSFQVLSRPLLSFLGKKKSEKIQWLHAPPPHLDQDKKNRSEVVNYPPSPSSSYFLFIFLQWEMLGIHTATHRTSLCLLICCQSHKYLLLKSETQAAHFFLVGLVCLAWYWYWYTHKCFINPISHKT